MRERSQDREESTTYGVLPYNQRYKIKGHSSIYAFPNDEPAMQR